MLWRAGVRGGALTLISAWKELLLLAALALVVAERRALPFSRSNLADVLALAFGLFVVVYALIPQSVLDGHATHKGIALRATPRSADRRRVLPRPRARAHRQGARAAVPCRARDGRRSSRVLGLVDVYAVSLAWWRLSAGWYQHQLGLNYGLASRTSRRTSSTTRARSRFRRLTSTFLSPLATAYLLVVAMFFIRSAVAGGSRSARCCSRRSSGRTRAPR